MLLIKKLITLVNFTINDSNGLFFDRIGENKFFQN